MKLSIALILLVPQLLFASVINNIWGHWVAENTIGDRDVQFRLSFYFAPRQTDLTVDCYFSDGAHLQSATSSYADYTGNAIYIRENRRNVSQDPNHYCQASLAPSVWNLYYGNYGRLILVMPVPYQSRFDLVRDYPHSIKLN